MALLFSAKRRIGMTWLGLALVMSCRPATAAQAAEANVPDDPPQIRFTPMMARGVAKAWVDQMKGRYELPDEKKKAAIDAVTYRVMELAHTINEPAMEFIERFVEEQLAGGGRGFMPPGFGKEFGERVLPMVPAIRELGRKCGQDIRPMLPMAGQLKLAGDLMAFKTGVDAFEETARKWSTGESKDFSDPFNKQDPGGKPKLDESGQAKRLKEAREWADKKMKDSVASEWEKYLKQFKEFYGLDAAQAATADSIFREYSGRVQQVERDQQRRSAVYCGKVWTQLIWRLPNGWNHPVRMLLDDELEQREEPIKQLEFEFKTRLETVPTSGQRKSADERVHATLVEKGLVDAGGSK